MGSFNLSEVLGISALPQYLKRVEDEMLKILLKDNDYMNAPLVRLMKAGGKRLRPALSISIMSASGKEIDDNLIKACVAIELVHLSSLIHDDIIDHSEERWGQPTIVSKEGIGAAILVGDYLLAKAGELSSSVSSEVGSITSRAASLLCEGQSREITDVNNLNRSVDSLISAIKGKTSSLFVAACEIGVVCSGGNDIQRKAIIGFAESYGISFQLIDDLMDLLSTKDLLGKPVSKDISEGIYTLPNLLALKESSDGKFKELLIIKNNSAATEYLIANGYLKTTLKKIKEYNQLAKDCLTDFPDTFDNLASLPKEYYDWATKNLVDKKYQSLIV